MSPSRQFSGNASPVEADGSFVCNGRNPAEYASFSNGALSWPGTISRTRLQQRIRTNGNNYDWGDFDGTGVPLSSRFLWGGSGPPTDALRFRRIPIQGSSGVVQVDFGASFVSIFTDPGGLTPILPTPGTNQNQQGTVDSTRAITLWEVLAYPADSALAKLARHCIAAYFNALAFSSTYPVTTGQAIAMWRDVVQLGGYCPSVACTAANSWDAAEVVAYLQSTYSTPDL